MLVAKDGGVPCSHDKQNRQNSFAGRTQHPRKMLSVPLLCFQSMIPRDWNCVFKKFVTRPWRTAEKYPSLLPLRKHEKLSPFSDFVFEKAGVLHCCCCYSVLGWMVAFLGIERFVCERSCMFLVRQTKIRWKVSLNPVKIHKWENGRREQDKGIHTIWEWYLFLMHSESEPASTQINWKNTWSREQKINLVMMNLT